jgi:hypothetical protein
LQSNCDLNTRSAEFQDSRLPRQRTQPIMPWNIRPGRKVYVIVLLATSAVAAWYGYKSGNDGEPPPTYEQQCRAICGTLTSQVKKTYIYPMSPESRRNMPRTIECLCGGSSIGKRLY